MPAAPLPPVWLMAAVGRLQAGLFRAARALSPGGVAAFDIVLQSLLASAMARAAELGLADRLLAGPQSVERLAADCAVDAGMLRRLLRALASQGVFRELRGGRFANTAISRGLADLPGSMKYMVISHQNADVLALFANLGHCLKTGRSAASLLWGGDAFSRMAGDAAEHADFVRAMDNSSDLAAPLVLAGLRLKGARRVVDLGGGLGKLLGAVLAREPRAEGWLVDRPETIAAARARLDPALAGRLRLVGGDFFADPLPAGDCYLLKNILHDWSDEDCVRLLRNVRRSIAPGGRVVAVDAVLPPGNRAHMAKLSDLLMMAGIDGGRERTRDEFRRVFQAAGFRLRRVRPTVGPFSILEAEPADEA